MMRTCTWSESAAAAWPDWPLFSSAAAHASPAPIRPHPPHSSAWPIKARASAPCRQRKNLPAETEWLVASAAIPANHPELVEAHRRGLPIVTYAQLLGALMAQRHGIAVSGTHGKSTTTAWLAYTLRKAGLDPSFVVGAECTQLGGGSGVGDGRHFVAEACEYNRSFLNLRPQTAAILNIEEDHLDYYSDLAAITEAFSAFANRVPPEGLLVINGQDAQAQKIAKSIAADVETFGPRSPRHLARSRCHPTRRPLRVQCRPARATTRPRTPRHTRRAQRRQRAGRRSAGHPRRRAVERHPRRPARFPRRLPAIGNPPRNPAVLRWWTTTLTTRLKSAPHCGRHASASTRASSGASSSRTSIRAPVSCFRISRGASSWPTTTIVPRIYFVRDSRARAAGRQRH